MKHIVYVHGLNATKLSFNYIKHILPEHDHALVEYDSHQPLAHSLEQVRKQLPKGELVMVGHSLGGVICALISILEPDRVKRLVTISAPLGGSKMAATIRWMPGADPVMADIIPGSPFIAMLQSTQLKIPTLSIISTAGSSKFIREPNDSVVTIDSQRALGFGKKVEIKANHFEILASDKTAKTLSDFVFKEEGLLYEEDHIQDGTRTTTEKRGGAQGAVSSSQPTKGRDSEKPTT